MVHSQTSFFAAMLMKGRSFIMRSPHPLRRMRTGRQSEAECQRALCSASRVEPLPSQWKSMGAWCVDRVASEAHSFLILVGCL